MGVTLSDALYTPYFAPYGFKISYVSTDYILTIVCLKQAILGLFRILRINKNPLICRRDLMWAVRDSNPRPPGCKPRAEDHFSIAYKIADSCQTLLAKNYREILIHLGNRLQFIQSQVVK